MGDWLKRLLFAPEPTPPPPSSSTPPQTPQKTPASGTTTRPSLPPATGPAAPLAKLPAGTVSASAVDVSRPPATAHKQGQIIPNAAATRNVRASESNIARTAPTPTLSTTTP